MAAQRRTRRITTPTSPSSPSLPSRRGHHHGFISPAKARLISPPPQCCAQLSAQPVGRHCRPVSDLARPPLPSMEPQNCCPPDNLESTCGNDVAIGPTCHPQWQHPWILGNSPRKTDAHDETSAAFRLLELPPTQDNGNLIHLHMPTTAVHSTVDAMLTTPRQDAPPTDIAPGAQLRTQHLCRADS